MRHPREARVFVYSGSVVLIHSLPYGDCEM